LFFFLFVPKVALAVSDLFQLFQRPYLRPLRVGVTSVFIVLQSVSVQAFQAALSYEANCSLIASCRFFVAGFALPLGTDSGNILCSHFFCRHPKSGLRISMVGQLTLEGASSLE